MRQMLVRSVIWEVDERGGGCEKQARDQGE